eukprot:SAG31_NODE_3615_length_4066_cov_3.735316_2_plen_709_part_00
MRNISISSHPDIYILHLHNCSVVRVYQMEDGQALTDSGWAPLHSCTEEQLREIKPQPKPQPKPQQPPQPPQPPQPHQGEAAREAQFGAADRLSIVGSATATRSKTSRKPIVNLSATGRRPKDPPRTSLTGQNSQPVLPAEMHSSPAGSAESDSGESTEPFPLAESIEATSPVPEVPKTIAMSVAHAAESLGSMKSFAEKLRELTSPLVRSVGLQRHLMASVQNGHHLSPDNPVLVKALTAVEQLEREALWLRSAIGGDHRQMNGVSIANLRPKPLPRDHSILAQFSAAAAIGSSSAHVAVNEEADKSEGKKSMGRAQVMPTVAEGTEPDIQSYQHSVPQRKELEPEPNLSDASTEDSTLNADSRHDLIPIEQTGSPTMPGIAEECNSSDSDEQLLTYETAVRGRSEDGPGRGYIGAGEVAETLIGQEAIRGIKQTMRFSQLHSTNSAGPDWAHTFSPQSESIIGDADSGLKPLEPAASNSEGARVPDALHSASSWSSDAETKAQQDAVAAVKRARRAAAGGDNVHTSDQASKPHHDSRAGSITQVEPAAIKSTEMDWRHFDQRCDVKPAHLMPPKLRVMTLTGQCYSISLPMNSSPTALLVGDLKREIANVEGTPVCLQRLSVLSSPRHSPKQSDAVPAAVRQHTFTSSNSEDALENQRGKNNAEKRIQLPDDMRLHEAGIGPDSLLLLVKRPPLSPASGSTSSISDR